MSGSFACTLIPPRTAFPADMTAAEATIRQEHFAYRRSLNHGRFKIVKTGRVLPAIGCETNVVPGGYGTSVVGCPES
jgi:hypothetical protein